MAPIPSTLRQLAVLGGSPAFPPGNPVPLISPKGFRPTGDWSSVDAILANDASDDSKARASQQCFVSKLVPGVGPAEGYRVLLQRRIGEFLKLDPAKSSVICVTSGTNALRALLKGVRVANGTDERDEVIVPAITVGATAEAVIDEGFTPVFVDVDEDSWMLSPEATERFISKRTAAIVTVDWLGAQCNLCPFRKLADEHGIKLISDSAQSFGATLGKPPSVDLAHATIYSLGYPKVFTGAGSGGIIVCPKSLANVLGEHPTGILRHETMAEINAFMCLRALDVLAQAPMAHAAAAKIYHQRLSSLPGITFQDVPDGMGTNHYQLSFTVDAQDFGLNAKDLCRALKYENVHCSADRMPCIGAEAKFLQCGKSGGDLRASKALAEKSVTLPITNEIALDKVEKICSLVEAIHMQAAGILAAKANPSSTCSFSPTESPDIIDIDSKFRRHLVVPVLDGSSVHSRFFVPQAYLQEHKISVDELLHHFSSQRERGLDETVVADLRVDAIIGKTVVLAPHDQGQSKSAGGSAVTLDESGSSANVTLVPRADGKLMVHKTAVGYGIDGNGAPWLRRQAVFLGASDAVKKTSMFVVPLEVNDKDSEVTLVFDYVPSHTFGELIFANIGAGPAVAAIVDLLARMSTSIWTENQGPANSQFIKQAHFDRMRRRVGIARKDDKMLDKILRQESVTLNGRQLRGFDVVMDKLSTHPELAKIGPTILTEIHGDLNIHNILGQLDPKEDEPVALIDPRGVPLLDDSQDKDLERGDYDYDVSKLLFSLTGFSVIRKKLYDFDTDGQSYNLTIQRHPGSDTVNGAAHQLIRALANNELMRQWIDKVEPAGVRSFELRARLGEAAHFIADCACALGRNTPWEVVPLFLIGLEKLNDVLDLLSGIGGLSTDDLEPSSAFEVKPESADLGAVTIQSTIFGLHTSTGALPYDVLEVSVKAESADATRELFREMVGTYLPEGTPVYLSTEPVGFIIPSSSPCVLIHPSNGVRGQTHMLAAATRRTSAFFRDHGVSEEVIGKLRIVHISSTGASSRSQFTARNNDKLLSPGSFGISPLKLVVIQANQLLFPKPGRWVVENDSFFLLSRPLDFSGDELCLLTIKRPTTGSSSSWRVCIDDVEVIGDRHFAKRFRNIRQEEKEEKLLRTTTGIFVPHRLAQEIASKEADYATRTSPLLIDVVLPRFMERVDWISLCHKQGYGVNAHLVWKNAERIKALAPEVELVSGGPEMAFYHYGSDAEYNELLAGVPNDPRLNSLAYVATAAQWRKRRVDPKLW